MPEVTIGDTTIALGAVLLGIAGFLLWLVLIWGSALLAHRKGRNPWVGAAFALLFNVVGLLIVFGIPPDREAQLRHKRAEREWAAEPDRLGEL